MKTLLLGLFLAGMAPAQDTSVKLGTLAPEGSPWHGIIRDMAEDWKKESGGKVSCRIFPGGVVGDEPDMVRKMRFGALHAAALTGVGLSEIAPEIMGIQMPMLVRTYPELDYVMERIAPRFEASLKAKGFIVLNWGDAGWVHFFSQKPVVTLDDLRTQKLFVWSTSAADAGVWKNAGVQPVSMASTDILVSLKSGAINAFSTTPLAALSFQWFGLAKNMTDLPWAPLIGATVVTAKKWESIPEAQRPALIEAARKSGARMKTEARKLGDEALKVMKDNGLVVHPVPPETLAEWEKQAKAAWPQVMGQSIPADLVAEIEKHLAEFRAKK